jgi:hypothetical protein
MTYCNSIMATCTGNAAQYKTQTDCMTACSLLAATGTDSIACRTTNLAAATGANMYQGCLQAGPYPVGACGDEHGSFCTLALGYCPGSYPDAATCQLTASLLTNVTQNSTGMYVVGNYTAAPAGATKVDTIECRLYQLINLAMDSAANATMYCPSVANNSPNCGPGVNMDAGSMNMVSDAGNLLGNPDSGTTVPTGPFVETGCTAGTAGCYPFAKRRMILRDEGDPHLHLIDLATPTNNWSTATDGPWARTAQLVGIPTGYTTPQILGGRNNGYEYYDLATGKVSHAVTNYANSMSPYRMRNGNTLLTVTGGTLKILDPTDKQIASVTYPGYGYVRLGRPAPARAGIFDGTTFLIPSDNTLFEGDLTGKVIKKITGGGSSWGHIWLPLVRKDGKVLLGTAFGSTVDVIDWSTANPTVTFRYGGKTGCTPGMGCGTYPMAPGGEPCWQGPGAGTSMPSCPTLTANTVQPNFFSEFQILPNGNILTPNWQGHGGGNGAKGIQVIEFNPAGQVVWYYKQDPAVFSSIQGAMLLDGLDATKLNVQDTDDGSWQAVQ